MGLLKKLFGRSHYKGKPQAVTDEDFEQMVLAPETPAVVDFWSPTCRPCQVISGLLDEIAPEYEGRLNIFKLNVDRNPQAVIQYQIRAVPTLILFNNHRPVERITGLIPINPLREKLDEFLKKRLRASEA